MMLSEDALKGRTVISADGHVIGTIRSIFIDPAEWRIATVCVSVRKEIAEQLGVDHGMFQRGVLEIPVRLFQSVGDTAVLGVPAASLRELQRPPQTSQPAPVH